MRALVVACALLAGTGCTGDRVEWQPAEVCAELVDVEPPPAWRLAAFWRVGDNADGAVRLAADVPVEGARGCVTLGPPPPVLQQFAREQAGRRWRETGEFDLLEVHAYGRRIAVFQPIRAALVAYVDGDADGALATEADQVLGLTGPRYADTLVPAFLLDFEHRLPFYDPFERRQIWALLPSESTPFMVTRAGEVVPWTSTVLPLESRQVQSCPAPEQVLSCPQPSVGYQNYLQGRWLDPRLDPDQFDPELELLPDVAGLYGAEVVVLSEVRSCTEHEGLLITRRVQTWRWGRAPCACEHGVYDVVGVTPAEDPVPGFVCPDAARVGGNAAELLIDLADLAGTDE